MSAVAVNDVRVVGDEVLMSPYRNTGRLTARFTFHGRPDRAVHFASGAQAVKNSTVKPDPSMPMWILALAWLEHDAPRLQTTSLPSYVSDLRNWILPIIGTRAQRDCGIAGYEYLFNELDMRGASESTRRQVARTVGTIATWALGAGWWVTDNSPFGPRDLRAKVRHSAFRAGRSADLAKGRTPGRIDATLCPSFADIQAFATALGDAAEGRWGPDARYVEDAPILQFLGGFRLGELLAAKTEDLLIGEGGCRIRIEAQYDKSKPCRPDGPALKTTKNGKPRTAAVWNWGEPHLRRIRDNARKSGRDVLFAPTDNQTTWYRRFEALYETVADTTGYCYTSHWHRHAYVSWNLATRDQGGYGRSLRQVADWVGHTDTLLLVRRYWHPVANEDGWSDHMPGAG